MDDLRPHLTISRLVNSGHVEPCCTLIHNLRHGMVPSAVDVCQVFIELLI